MMEELAGFFVRHLGAVWQCLSCTSPMSGEECARYVLAVAGIAAFAIYVVVSVLCLVLPNRLACHEFLARFHTFAVAALLIIGLPWSILALRHPDGEMHFYAFLVWCFILMVMSEATKKTAGQHADRYKTIAAVVFVPVSIFGMVLLWRYWDAQWMHAGGGAGRRRGSPATILLMMPFLAYVGIRLRRLEWPRERRYRRRQQFIKKILDDFRAYANIPKGVSVDVHTRSANGATVLHFLAHLGNGEGVKIFSAHGANLNAQDTDGNTPLHEAVSSKQTAAVRALLACGADAGIRNRAGQTPKDMARGVPFVQECFASREGAAAAQTN